MLRRMLLHMVLVEAISWTRKWNTFMSHPRLSASHSSPGLSWWLWHGQMCTICLPDFLHYMIDIQKCSSSIDTYWHILTPTLGSRCSGVCVNLKLWDANNVAHVKPVSDLGVTRVWPRSHESHGLLIVAFWPESPSLTPEISDLLGESTYFDASIEIIFQVIEPHIFELFGWLIRHLGLVQTTISDCVTRFSCPLELIPQLLFRRCFLAWPGTPHR